MLQLTRTGTRFSGSAEDLEGLRIQFDRQHCIRLPQLVEPGLLQLVQSQIGEAEFHPGLHGGIGAEDRMMENFTLDLLYFLTNTLQLFQIVQQITGCARIGCFAGRVYRFSPGCSHYDSWHNDMIGDRMIGMSINLSTEAYSGGIFQLRERNSEKISYQVANTGLGDGIIFRLAPHLVHRVTEVEGTVPKTAFAGWFQSQPDFLSLLKQKPRQPR